LAITENTPIQRFERGEAVHVEDTLVTEKDVAIELGSEKLIRTTCSPDRLREWVIGYLFTEGRIVSPDDVAEIHEIDGGFSVELAESAPLQFARITPVMSNLTVDPERLLAAAREVADRADVFNQTGGTHAIAIADCTKTLSLVEDISRTCALEKAVGGALLRGVDFASCFAFVSSRVPSRMIAKLARCGLPVVAAVSAPTMDSVRLAEELNVCLCGFVRGKRLNVYAHGWRVGL
jgi:FdhD protein